MEAKFGYDKLAAQDIPHKKSVRNVTSMISHPAQRFPGNP